MEVPSGSDTRGAWPGAERPDARPRPRAGRRVDVGGLAPPVDVLPVVKSHVAGDQRPVSNLRPQPRDVVSDPDGDTGDVLVEPRAHFVAHDADAFLGIRLAGQALDELVELRILDEQVQRGLGVAAAN